MLNHPGAGGASHTQQCCRETYTSTPVSLLPMFPATPRGHEESQLPWRAGRSFSPSLGCRTKVRERGGVSGMHCAWMAMPCVLALYRLSHTVHGVALAHPSREDSQRMKPAPEGLRILRSRNEHVRRPLEPNLRRAPFLGGAGPRPPPPPPELKVGCDNTFRFERLDFPMHCSLCKISFLPESLQCKSLCLEQSCPFAATPW